jgi:transcriptional regulator GlxA family with amidase domain
MLQRVAVLVLDNVAPFELGVICEVFGTDRTADGFPGYEFHVCSPGGATVRTTSGWLLTPTDDLTALDHADLVAVPAHPIGCPAPPEAVAALRRAAERGAQVLSVCSGAFLLGEAGLLDGRRCTTHWKHAGELARRFPAAKVDPDVLYVADDHIATSAGTAAGIDLCLHLVRREHGSAVATALARRMVVPPHRDGGQAQYIETPVPEHHRGDDLSEVLAWARAHLDTELTVRRLAARANMSPRTFARRFLAVTGTTPHQWLVTQRVEMAQRLLEETDHAVEVVAQESGFGTAAMLRHHFGLRRGTSPQLYRRTFRRYAPLIGVS